jgi:hypothetical protein
MLRTSDVVPSARSSRTWFLAALGSVFALGCTASPPPSGASAPRTTPSPAPVSTPQPAAVVAAPPSPAATLPARAPAEASTAIHAMLDDWHRAAASADEARYFSHFTSDAICSSSMTSPLRDLQETPIKRAFARAALGRWKRAITRPAKPPGARHLAPRAVETSPVDGYGQSGSGDWPTQVSLRIRQGPSCPH